MNVKTMEGLMGANANINLAKTPMRVYEEAQIKGEEDKMERAMGYVGDFSGKALTYAENTNEGLIEEAEEAREEQRAELEKEAEKIKMSPADERAKSDKSVKTNFDGDTAEISEEAQEYAEEAKHNSDAAADTNVKSYRGLDTDSKIKRKPEKAEKAF